RCASPWASPSWAACWSARCSRSTLRRSFICIWIVYVVGAGGNRNWDMRVRSLAHRARVAVPAAACALLLAACAVGPDYQRPALEVGAAYRHAPEGQWRRAQPGGAGLDADWWRMFGDAGLDGMMASLAGGNLDIAIAEAQYRQARASL